MSITRRAFLQHVSTFTGALAAGSMIPRTVRAASPPNILFIYTDDQAYWSIGALGNPQAYTPHLDRLVREGVSCDNAFVTTPVCSPSRVGLLCSRYGTEVGILDWINPNTQPEHGLDPATPSWVRLLRDAGYRTGLVGKWHLGTQDRFHPTQFGYDYFAGFRPGGAKVENMVLEIDGEERQMEGLTVDRLTDLALGFIEDSAQPFALSLHYRSPHAPWLPVAEEDGAPYASAPLDLPDAGYPELDTERVEQSYREYLSSVSGIDRNVGRLLAMLDERGLSDNTVVIFTSDHGYNIGHHGLIHKGNGSWITRGARDRRNERDIVTRPNMFDTSLRVPQLVRWPGRVRGGSKVTQCVTNLDWFPTLLAMAGLAVPEEVQIRGRNFLPLLEGQAIPWEDAFYGEYSIRHYVEADLRMYRTTSWKLVRDYRHLGRDELYDLANDPDERRNLVHDPATWEVYRDLNARLLQTMDSLEDRVAER